jgi:uncharacterized RmlC-like cupin family protein
MGKISGLSSVNQRTVERLSREKKVSVDRITGLVNSIRTEFYDEHPDATGMDWSYGTTTINGSTPPGRLLPLQDTVEVVDKIVGGQHVSVMLGTRKAGTRVGIHVHESGGTTFVVGGKGRITDFVEGFPNSFNPVGSYYYMPSNIPMSAANLSKRDVRLMDVFITPVGEAAITIIEPGYPGYNPPA